MFRRKVYESLQRWATRRGQTALLVTGARQIGKSYLVERLGREKYQRLLTVNLYLDKAAKRSLAEASNVADLITRLSLMADQPLVPGETLIFIDEIHRLSRSVEEVLYPAMEDYALDIMIGKGPTARSIRLDLPRFTLVGATTRAGLLSAPLRDRFGILFRLEMYSPQELAAIVRRSAGILNVRADDEGILEIARRSRGTPRIANRMLRRVRDFAQIRAGGVITLEVARQGMDLLDVDELGLEKLDRAMLETMIDKFAGGPVGLETLSAMTGEDASTIEDVYEPYLMQLGFLTRTPRGRVVMPVAYEHLGRKPQTPPDEGEQLKI